MLDPPQALRERIRKNEAIIYEREVQSCFKKGKFKTDKKVGLDPDRGRKYLILSAMFVIMENIQKSDLVTLFVFFSIKYLLCTR